VQYHYIK